MYNQLPIETNQVSWSHLSDSRPLHDLSSTKIFASLPGAGELPFFVACFLHKACHFEQETSALQRSGSPKHLQQIKTSTQNLIIQAAALTHLLENTGLPHTKHLLTLVRDCERSGCSLLIYLHRLVASTRATIVPNSRKPILADLKWTPIRNLINTVRALKSFMEAVGLVKRCENKNSMHTRLSSDFLYSSGPRVTSERAQNGPQTNNEPPSIASRGKSLGDLNWGRRDAFNLLDTHASYQRRQPSFHSRKDTIGNDFFHRSSQRTVDTMRVLSTCAEWERIFRRQPLPALVLYYATKPCEDALTTTVTQLDDASSLQSLLHLDRILHSSCYKLLDIRGPEGMHDARLMSPGYSFNCDRAIVVSSNGLDFEALRSKRTSELLLSGRENQNPDSLNRLASACLMVLKTRDPRHSPLSQRCLLYLAHILRHAASTAETNKQYLNGVADAMAQSHVRDTSRSTPWSTLPQATGSLCLKPELQCFADVLTFAAREALPLPLDMLPTYDESRRRFAITAHALASWNTYLPESHPDKSLLPGLQERQEMLRYLLTHITPPESTVCFGAYSLCKEALRLCNSGNVKDPLQLLVIFLAKSERPDLLWDQTLRPSVEIGWNACELLTALREEASSATAPQLLQMVICQIEQTALQAGGQFGRRQQDDGGGVVEWTGW